MGNGCSVEGNMQVMGNLQCCAAVRDNSVDECDASPCARSRSPLIVFDWDDTLMCSSDIKAHKNPSPEDMRLLERSVQEVLSLSLGLGKTIIVTNANLCWVRATANLFMPAVVPLLKLIDVMSARQRYEERWPGDPGAWKKQAFLDLVGDYHAKKGAYGQDVATEQQEGSGKTTVNLVVLGDSHAEIQAGRSAMRDKRDGVVKTIKFKEAPTTEEMIGQLKAVSTGLHEVVAQEQGVSKQLVRGSISSTWSMTDTAGASWLSLL
jgi:hypothetical protein